MKKSTIKTLDSLGYGVFENKIYLKKVIVSRCITDDSMFKSEIKRIRKLTSSKLEIFDSDGIIDIYEIINPMKLKRVRNLFDNIFKKNDIVTFDEFIEYLESINN
ncbi:MAG: hypothetical protein ACRCXT_16320 [Paraclostridium sp.]